MGKWRKLHNEDLHNMCSSPNIKVIKLWRMRWPGHVACRGDICTEFKLGNLEGRD
jgi:hypothetical protein